MVQNFEESRRQVAADHFRSTVDGLKQTLDRLEDSHFSAIETLAADTVNAWRQGGKIMICGNGGSAADSQHIAAELVGRFLAERPGYAALALTTNSSVLKSVRLENVGCPARPSWQDAVRRYIHLLQAGLARHS